MNNNELDITYIRTGKDKFEFNELTTIRICEGSDEWNSDG